MRDEAELFATTSTTDRSVFNIGKPTKESSTRNNLPQVGSPSSMIEQASPLVAPASNAPTKRRPQPGLCQLSDELLLDEVDEDLGGYV